MRITYLPAPFLHKHACGSLRLDVIVVLLMLVRLSLCTLRCACVTPVQDNGNRLGQEARKLLDELQGVQS